MINKKLLDHIEQQLKEGVNREDIEQPFIQSGWSDADVDEVFSALQTPSEPVKKYDKTKLYDFLVSFALANIFLIVFSLVFVTSWLILASWTAIFYFTARFAGKMLREKNKLILRHSLSLLVALLVLLGLSISGYNFIDSFKNSLLFREAKIVVGSDIDQYNHAVLWSSKNFRRDDRHEEILLNDFSIARLSEFYDQPSYIRKITGSDGGERKYIVAKRNPVSGLLLAITFNELLIFNEDFSYAEKIEIPVKKQSFRDTFVAEWIGDNIIAYEKKRTNYYIYKQKRDSVELLPNLRRKITDFLEPPGYIPFYPNPAKTLIATSYCVSDTNWGQGFSGARCTKYGVSMVDTFGAREIATVRTKDNQVLDIGWDNDNNFYIKIFTPENRKESLLGIDKIYIINTTSMIESGRKGDYGEAGRIDTELGKPKGEPVWMEQEIKTEEIVNIVNFEAEFIGGERSEGLLTIYFDGEEVGRIYEYQAPKGLNEYVFQFNDIPPGIHTLKFYLEPLNKEVRSNITLKNIKTGFTGIK